jgi:hypothetical protein
VFVVRYWKTPVVFSAAPLLLCAIAVGCMITYLSILMRALNECGMNQALYSLGYSVVLAAFYVKSYRIDCVFNSTGLKPSLSCTITVSFSHDNRHSPGLGLPKSATPKELNKRFAFVMLIEIVLEVASLVPFPVTLQTVVKSTLNEAALCIVPAPVVSIFAARKLFLITLNIYYAYKVRNVNSAFNEAKIIAFCVYNMGFFICLGTSFKLLLQESILLSYCCEITQLYMALTCRGSAGADVPRPRGVLRLARYS